MAAAKRLVECFVVLAFVASVVTSGASPVVGGAFPGPNGKIAFQTFRTGDSEIFAVDPDGSNPVNLSQHPNSDDHHPDWSADGTRVVFEREDTEEGDVDIWVMNADGSGQTRLTNEDGGSSPSWSPDGSKIAFASAPEDGLGFDIWVMNADGSDPEPLTNDEFDDDQPAWSPDGSKIAFISDRDDPLAEGMYDIHVMDADGGNRVNVTNSVDVHDIQPTWSPDGTKIAWVSSLLSPGQQIHVMNAGGTSPAVVTNDPHRPIHPAWTPDGTAILYARHILPPGPDEDPEGEDFREIRSQPIGGGVATPITTGAEPSQQPAPPPSARST